MRSSEQVPQPPLVRGFAHLVIEAGAQVVIANSIHSSWMGTPERFFREFTALAERQEAAHA